MAVTTNDYSFSATGTGADKMRWRPQLEAGAYDVSIWLPFGGSARSTNAPYTVYDVNGAHFYEVNLQGSGGYWINLGVHTFATGTSGYVELTDDANNNYVIGDAIRFRSVVVSGFIATVDDFSRNYVVFDARLRKNPGPLDNVASIGLSGTSDAPVGSPIECRVMDEDNNLVQDWYEIGSVVAEGEFEGTLEIGIQDAWLRPEVRAKRSTAAPSTTSNFFGAGLIVIYSEQSNMARVLQDGSAPKETIGANGHDFQLYKLENRGGVTGSDANSTVAGPIYVTDANPQSNGLAAMAAAFHKNAPGLKVMVLFDVKPGIGQNETLEDAAIRRNWNSIKKLLSRGEYANQGALQDGQDVGVFVLTHRTNTPVYADYWIGASLGKYLDGNDIPGVDPMGTFASVAINSR